MIQTTKSFFKVLRDIIGFHPSLTMPKAMMEAALSWTREVGIPFVIEAMSRRLAVTTAIN